MPPKHLTSLVAAFLAVIRRLSDAISEAARPSDTKARFARMAAAWFWLDTRLHRFLEFTHRAEAGRLRPLRPRSQTGPRRPAKRDEERLPPLRYGFGWFPREIPECAAVIAEFEARLAAPEFRPLLEAEPARFARLLRPICRALGLTPPEPLRQPPAATAPAEPAEPKPPAPPAPDEWRFPSASLPRRGDPELDALSPKIA